MNTQPTSDERVFHEYLCVETSAEVWAVIQARHGKQLRVFSSFSDPSGTQFGGGGTEGRMETTYGFARGDHPVIGAKTTWTIETIDGTTQARGERQTTYFMMIPRNRSDD